ncbi:hypothetical protein CMV30_11120 [Nibricoccus aquaticus]|uniref:Glycogen debranching protein n=1 Tax=Nibricoccus aquaticus TaxID=2576891 RepID=A0A290QB87_9BACT|nr:DUF4450 domain-containing protein [Nibricoccus aquaticus]ATC64460.1 hypothetical protein CMV30_11120 [Nibricoccus aquaticus]
MKTLAHRCLSVATLVCFASLPVFSLAAIPDPAPATTTAPKPTDDFPATTATSPGAPVASPNLVSNIERPLRYRPDANGDFVIENGTARFNRPLYGFQTAFRVEASDRPEFGFATPRKGGVLRIGISTPSGSRWLNGAAKITARYRPGSMIYEVRDPLLGAVTINLTALPTKDAEGLILRAELSGKTSSPVELVLLFGGASNEAINNRGGDILGGRDNASKWELLPADCAGQKITLSTASAANTFTLESKAGTFVGTLSAPGRWSVGDATVATGLDKLLTSVSHDAHPVAIGRIALSPSTPSFIAIQRSAKETPLARTAAGLPAVFSDAETYRLSVVSRVIVDTPDPFVNAIPAAIAISGDALWTQSTVMHGNIAWRMPLLGWRGQYVFDAFGWHDRAREHFRMWAAKQNTDPASIPPAPRADPAKNLATDDWKTLHSYGGIPARHYDMALVFVDTLLRHLIATGDKEFAKEMWPYLTRHLAWEKRLFDRGGLYEAYAAIWASDALTYNGGGAAHSTAYNYFHNATAARIARLIGEDPAPYDAEAKRIHEAMHRELWLSDRGWYAEYKELHGLKRVHPAAALWTVYHTIDSRVPDPFQAYQTLRYVDTHLPRIPVRGPGVPAGDWFTLPSTNWVPYEWSLNNVYLGETAHTALAYWQGGRPDVAWQLWKGTLLDSMFMGLNPGSLPNLSQYDVYRRETYRDFGDSTGITSRSLIEGLFGISPDGIDGVLTIRPGFPTEWDHASIKTPDVTYAYKRTGDLETFKVEPRFAKLLSLHLNLPARSEKILSVESNGKPVAWKNDDTAIGAPRIVIDAPAAQLTEVVIRWSGSPFKHVKASSSGVPLRFGKIMQGDFTWSQPVGASASPAASPESPTFADYTAPADARFDPVDLSPLFNDKLTQIFKNEYLSPRSPHVSLSMPKQGIGSWSGFSHTAEIDDTGLRSLAAKSQNTIQLPSGLPLRTPSDPAAKNTAFVSLWDNYPDELTAPLTGRARSVTVLVAGSTSPMQSQIDNGEIVITYTDGTTSRLALHNPTTWWPIEQDYMVDDYAFRRTAPVPLRLELKSGKFYTPTSMHLERKGGAATVLALPLDPSKELRSLTIRALSTESVIGLLSATLVR